MKKIKVKYPKIEFKFEEKEIEIDEERLEKLKNCEGDFQKDIWTFVTQYFPKELDYFENCLNASFSDIVLLKLQGWL